MRITLLKLLKRITTRVTLPEPIYEFGAQRVPGQQHLPHVSSYFPGKRFVGCDLVIGDGVNEVQDLHQLSLPDASIGTALLFDTIEHVRDPWVAMRELHRCLRPGGLLVMTSVWYFPIHAYPDDYWRFTASGFRTLFQNFEPLAVTMCGLARLPHTVVGVAGRGPVPADVAAGVREVVDEWAANDAHSWKETVMELTPPRLLIPAYDRFLKTMNLVNRLMNRSSKA